MSRASSFRSRRLQDKRKKAIVHKYVGGILFLVITILGLSLLSRAEFARVGKVVVEGNELIRTEVLKQIVDSTLESSYLKLFSKNNFVLFPRGKIEKQIQQQFATVGAASVSFDGFKTVLVKVIEHEPAHLWCDSAARDHCYFMDANGFIFSESADFSKNVLFTYYGLVDPGQPIGKTFMPQKEFTELKEFIDSLQLLKLTAVGLNARSEGDFELHLSPGGSILFSNKEDFLTTFENLETTVTEETKKDPNFLRRLEYIDVRFASKAFVKLK